MFDLLGAPQSGTRKNRLDTRRGEEYPPKTGN
jgi:hypothetical protein